MCTISGNLMAALSTNWQEKMVIFHFKIILKHNKNIFMLTCCFTVLVVIGGTGEHNDTEISVEYLDLDAPTQWTFLNSVHTPRCCWPQVKQIYYLLK